ncbi:MAG: DinB family protein [Acidobacteria bacterium]|nr:DinB family protein [Acidobacteriota bacterium]
MHATRTLIAQNIEFLRQGRRLIEALPDTLYRDGVPPLGKSGVGGHFRHCLDFYSCFAAGLESGRVDYDLRSRDSVLESDRMEALGTIDSAIRTLDSLTERSPELPLEVSVDCPGEALGGPFWSRSTLLRELQMLSGHTVHHYALIAMLLRARGFDPGADFGVAPSTLDFERRCAATG